VRSCGACSESTYSRTEFFESPTSRATTLIGFRARVLRAVPASSRLSDRFSQAALVAHSRRPTRRACREYYGRRLRERRSIRRLGVEARRGGKMRAPTAAMAAPEVIERFAGPAQSRRSSRRGRRRESCGTALYPSAAPVAADPEFLPNACMPSRSTRSVSLGVATRARRSCTSRTAMPSARVAISDHSNLDVAEDGDYLTHELMANDVT